MSIDKTEPNFSLDLRGVACPMNFVRTKLAVDKMCGGQVVAVLLDSGEPVESVCASILAEGHEILENVQKSAGHFCLIIRKV